MLADSIANAKFEHIYWPSVNEIPPSTVVLFTSDYVHPSRRSSDSIYSIKQNDGLDNVRYLVRNVASSHHRITGRITLWLKDGLFTAYEW